jgi:hypothetical protein
MEKQEEVEHVHQSSPKVFTSARPPPPQQQQQQKQQQQKQQQQYHYHQQQTLTSKKKKLLDNGLNNSRSLSSPSPPYQQPEHQHQGSVPIARSILASNFNGSSINPTNLATTPPQHRDQQQQQILDEHRLGIQALLEEWWALGHPRKWPNTEVINGSRTNLDAGVANPFKERKFSGRLLDSLLQYHGISHHAAAIYLEIAPPDWVPRARVNSRAKKEQFPLTKNQIDILKDAVNKGMTAGCSRDAAAKKAAKSYQLLFLRPDGKQHKFTKILRAAYRGNSTHVYNDHDRYVCMAFDFHVIVLISPQSCSSAFPTS